MNSVFFLSVAVIHWTERSFIFCSTNRNCFYDFYCMFDNCGLWWVGPCGTWICESV